MYCAKCQKMNHTRQIPNITSLFRSVIQ